MEGTRWGGVCLVVTCHLLLAVPPSPELVKRVRDLYHKRLPDVRFLIPVLNGLEKVRVSPPPLVSPRVPSPCVTSPDVPLLLFWVQKEVIQALPKLIKLNPIVVKEVFNRLLGTQHGRGWGQPRDMWQLWGGTQSLATR